MEGRFQEAAAESGRAVSLRSGSAAYHSRRGAALFRALAAQRRGAAAASQAHVHFKEATELDGGDARYWYNLAVLYAAPQQSESARRPSELLRGIEDCARRAAGLDGGEARYHNLLGCKHFRCGAMAPACAAFRAAAAAPSARPLHLNNLGVTCILEKRFDEAVLAFERGAALARSSPPPPPGSGPDSGGGGEEAGGCFKDFNMAAVGVAYCRALRFWEGARAFERAVDGARAQGTPPSLLYMNLAFAHVGAGCFRRARKVLEEGKRAVAERRKELGPMYAGPVNFWELAELVEEATHLHAVVADYRRRYGRVYEELYEVFWLWRTAAVKPYSINTYVVSDAAFII